MTLSHVIVPGAVACGVGCGSLCLHIHFVLFPLLGIQSLEALQNSLTVQRWWSLQLLLCQSPGRVSLSTKQLSVTSGDRSHCTSPPAALVSRQYMDMSRIRIEGLLAAFPKLVSTGKQHTFVETENVRYVYQPIEVSAGLYLLPFSVSGKHN